MKKVRKEGTGIDKKLVIDKRKNDEDNPGSKEKIKTKEIKKELTTVE